MKPEETLIATTNRANYLHYPIFLGSEIDQPNPKDAKFHVLPVPFEKSVSYGGGTWGGPSAILHASWQLEEFDGKSRPCDNGIYTRRAVDCDANSETVMQRIADSVKAIINDDAMPVVLGGEHSITQGVIKGLINAGMEDIGVIQFDAHADLRHAYEGDRFSHASVMKRIVEMGIPLYQLGVRALCEEEIQAREEFKVQFIDAEQMALDGTSSLKLNRQFPKNVFISFDVDGLDPSIMPATGTPVAGGLGWYQALQIIESIAKNRNIIGFDMVEFSPIENFHAYDFTSAQLIYKIMGIIQRSNA